MLTITLLGTAATMPLPDRHSRRRLLPAAATACCGTAARARRQRHTGRREPDAGRCHLPDPLPWRPHLWSAGPFADSGGAGPHKAACAAGPEDLPDIWAAVRALTGPLPYPVKPQVLMPGQPLALDALSEGWPAGARLVPFATKHRVKSLATGWSCPVQANFRRSRPGRWGCRCSNGSCCRKGRALPWRAERCSLRRCWAHRARG